VVNGVTSFFDVVPCGHVISRLSTHIDVLDDQLPEFMEQTISLWLVILSNILVVSTQYPLFVLPLLALMAIFFIRQRILSSYEPRNAGAPSHCPSSPRLYVALFIRLIFFLRNFCAENRQYMCVLTILLMDDATLCACWQHARSQKHLSSSSALRA
jgi:hypothetical protein